MYRHRMGGVSGRQLVPARALPAKSLALHALLKWHRQHHTQKTTHPLSQLLPPPRPSCDEVPGLDPPALMEVVSLLILLLHTLLAFLWAATPTADR